MVLSLSFEFRLLMRIDLKHKLVTFLINRLIRVVPYIGIWSIFHIAQTQLVREYSDFTYYPNSEQPRVKKKRVLLSSGFIEI